MSSLNYSWQTSDYHFSDRDLTRSSWQTTETSPHQILKSLDGHGRLVPVFSTTSIPDSPWRLLNTLKMQDSPRHHQDSGSSRLSGRRQDRFFQILKTSSGQWFIDSLQLALDRLVVWCNDWQMQIAINKCSMLWVGTMPITPSLNINGFFFLK